MGHYWVNFAYDGNPNYYPYIQKTRWEAWGAEQFLDFDLLGDKGIKMYLSSLSEASILQSLENSVILNHQRCKTLHDLLSRSLLNDEEKKKYFTRFYARYLLVMYIFFRVLGIGYCIYLIKWNNL